MQRCAVHATPGLGDALGLTFQQVQKYERGANRIGAGRLYDVSRVLDVPIEHFFEDMPPEVAASSLTATTAVRMTARASRAKRSMLARRAR